MVMMIYDGMTQESIADDYLAVTREYKFDLCVLNIKDSRQNVVMGDIERMVKAITADEGVQGRKGNYQILDVSRINELPMAVAKLMNRQFDRVLSRMKQVFEFYGCIDLRFAKHFLLVARSKACMPSQLKSCIQSEQRVQCFEAKGEANACSCLKHHKPRVCSNFTGCWTCPWHPVSAAEATLPQVSCQPVPSAALQTSDNG